MQSWVAMEFALMQRTRLSFVSLLKGRSWSLAERCILYVETCPSTGLTHAKTCLVIGVYITRPFFR